MTKHDQPRVCVELDVLVAPDQEERLSEAIRSAVDACVPEPGFTLSVATWDATSADDDLVRQWQIEQDTPLDGRRARQFTMDVQGEGVENRVDEISWAAIEAICPSAREEDRRISAGERIPFVADEFPWSSATRVIEGSIEDSCPQVELVPMLSDQFDAYREGAQRDYAANLLKADLMPESEATEKALNDFDRLLPEGDRTEGQEFWTALDDGEEVGMLWLAFIEKSDGLHAFGYDFSVTSRFRHRGYGRAILTAAEKVCRERGVVAVGLSVFGFNSGAQALYQDAGFEVSMVQMVKRFQYAQPVVLVEPPVPESAEVLEVDRLRPEPGVEIGHHGFEPKRSTPKDVVEKEDPKSE